MIPLDLKGQRELLVDWFAHLGNNAGLDFHQYSSGTDSYTVGAMTGLHVHARFVDTRPFLRFEASDPDYQTAVDKIAAEAANKVDNSDFGEGVWYSTTLNEIPWTLQTPFAMGAFFLRLGMQTRILGWRRLGGHILLEFKEREGENENAGEQPLVPLASVAVHIGAPGPAAGHFSSRVAHGVIETIAAICGFALGRPVDLPPALFPATDEQAAQLEQHASDQSILALARKHVALDLFNYLPASGGLDVFRRAQSALITYDAAAQQQRHSVACILYVAAAESLCMPSTDWRHAKLTKRFIDFFDALMPGDLDVIVAHDNFEQTFELTRGNKTAKRLRREFLDAAYDYRSGQLHGGITSTYRGFLAGSDFRSESRRGLLADFAEGAILRYLGAPRSSLIGHPLFEPDSGGCTA